VVLAKKPKKKEKRQWQTGYLPRLPTSPHRSQSLHAGWSLVCSSIFQVLLKSVQWFCRCGWSKIALPHYFGHWLIQQLVLPYKPWSTKAFSDRVKKAAALFNWISCIADRRRQLSCVGDGVYSDATQLNSTSSWVELRRYQRALKDFPQCQLKRCFCFKMPILFSRKWPTNFRNNTRTNRKDVLTNNTRTSRKLCVK